MSYTSISPHDARIQQQQGVPLIDIRQPDEFRREHLPDALSLPLEDLLAGKRLSAAAPAQTVIFHCQSGMRTQKNVEALIQAAALRRCCCLKVGWRTGSARAYRRCRIRLSRVR